HDEGRDADGAARADRVRDAVPPGSGEAVRRADARDGAGDRGLPRVPALVHPRADRRGRQQVGVHEKEVGAMGGIEEKRVTRRRLVQGATAAAAAGVLAEGAAAKPAVFLRTLASKTTITYW